MNRRLSQALAVILSKKIKNAKKSNSVLFLLPMGLGDAVLFLDTIDYYFEKYKNKSIYFMTTAVANKVFKMARPKLEYSLIEYNPMEMDTNISYYLRTLKNVGSLYYDEVIYPLRGFLTMDLLYSKLRSDRKVTIDTIKEELSKGYKVKLRDYFIKNTEIIRFQPDNMDLIRYARIAEKICNRPIKAKLPKIELNGNTAYGYCQISIGSSRPEKCWPLEKYAAVTRYILDNTNYDVVFTGSKEDGVKVNQLIKTIKVNTSRIHNKCGLTTLEELFSIIAGARLLLGGDSGPIHVSVACNTPAICIVGGWDYERMYPYQVEVHEKERRAPVVVNTGVKSCYRCLLLHGSRGATNPECAKMIEAGRPCLCIDDITTDLVVASIKDVLSKQEGKV